MSSRRLRAILREPLVHFLAVGILLVAADRWRRGEPATPPSATARAPASPASTGPIVVGGDIRTSLRDGLARAAGGTPPSAAELDEAVARWVDEEVLYREGLARGLDRDDPAVRKRVAEKMAFILEQSIVVTPPTEADLRAWFESRRDTWSRPLRVDFTHVFVAETGADAERRAAALLAELEKGADPEPLGDRFSGGQRYRGRKLADLAESFGPEFARQLDRQPPGTWQLRRSRHGLHLVRLDRVEPARSADFASARLDVEKEWVDARRAEELAARVRSLRARWPVVEK
ncbi:MAG TPA: peptidylprolyl isomerase [Kofleriaceae bacterium]